MRDAVPAGVVGIGRDHHRAQRRQRTAFVAEQALEVARQVALLVLPGLQRLADAAQHDQAHAARERAVEHGLARQACVPGVAQRCRRQRLAADRARDAQELALDERHGADRQVEQRADHDRVVVAGAVRRSVAPVVALDAPRP